MDSDYFSSCTRRADHPFSQHSPVHLLLVVRYGGGCVAGQSCPTYPSTDPGCCSILSAMDLGDKVGCDVCAVAVLCLCNCGRADGTKLFSCYQNSVIVLCIFSPLRYLQRGGWCWRIVGFAQLRTSLLEDTFWMIYSCGIQVLCFFLVQV